MNITSQLIKSGLSKNEAGVYLTTLQLGQATILEISRHSSIKRTTVYEVMPLLIERGLISQGLKQKRRVFIAEPASNLYRQKNHELDTLGQLLPLLDALRNSTAEKPVLKWFEGKEAVQQIITGMVLKTELDDSILAVESKFDDILQSVGQDFFKRILKEKKLRGLRSRTIITMSKAELAKAVQKTSWSVDHDISIKLLGDFANKFKVNLYMYQNKTVIIIPRQLLALVIEDQSFKDSFSFLFEVMWQHAQAA